MAFFNVWLHGKLVDTVSYSMGKSTIAAAVEDTRRSLIDHDGYDPEIKVTWPKGQRVTEVEHVVQGDYGYGHGFEDESSESTRAEGLARLKEYRENGPGIYRLVRRNVRKENP